MKLLDIKAIAQMLNIKPSTIYQWTELGQIPCIKLNGALRFDIEDINQWISSCKRQARSGYNPFTKSVTSSPKKGGR
ncbi:MAG: helix-turn-helix domain-containing protein [Thermodesulfovibrionales bacterium]|jgi:excisionase family DNA binding protein|nr:helix-turn-helix domain-containing protein [Thermodesulfovibrionales bacterium]